MLLLNSGEFCRLESVQSIDLFKKKLYTGISFLTNYCDLLYNQKYFDFDQYFKYVIRFFFY